MTSLLIKTYFFGICLPKFCARNIGNKISKFRGVPIFYSRGQPDFDPTHSGLQFGICPHPGII